MIPYCSINNSLTEPWVNQGLNRCFVSTLNSSLLAILFFIPGLLQLIVYKKYGRPLTADLRSHSAFLSIQLMLMLTVPVLVIARVMVYGFMSPLERVYGFMIYDVITACLLWPLACALLYMESHRVIINIEGRGHGLILLSFWTVSLFLIYLPLLSIFDNEWWWKMTSATDIAELTLWLINAVCVTFIFVLGIWAPGLPNYFAVYQNINVNRNRQLEIHENLWLRRYHRFKLLYPFIWPKKNKSIQLRVLICVLLLIAGRVTNIFSPIVYKDIVNSLTLVNQTVHNNTLRFKSDTVGYTSHLLFNKIVGENGLIYRWDYVLLLGTLRFLQGLGGLGAGLIASLRAQLWIPVDQYSTREMSVILFGHLQKMSMKWHLSRKTGEMLRVVDRGTASVSNILSYLVFNIFPTVVDIFIGVVYFVLVFNFWYGLLVFVTMIIYLGLTVAITEWRTEFRRTMNKLDNQKNTKAVDALLNFETVKYFNAEQFEMDRFKDAFVEYQKADWWTNSSLNVLNSVQNVVISSGFLIGTLLCSRDVVLGRLTVGDFVLFCTYILQLYSPLSVFGTYYRLLQTSMIDMENMFELLEQDTEILDAPNAQPLNILGGEIEFKNVSFHYDPERPILKNISFKVPSGKTVALVGESGSGKSTIVRLLFRFYDVIDGEISIDNQNIALVTQSSLRQAIGVVPQDTVLFNDTISYNIFYGSRTASQNEIELAAFAADIHRTILGFPQQYETVVGERGLKLSGGEKQRVAIARNLLKNPSIVVLDEATSALDTATERNIQTSLNKIAQNRTTLIVAHRLSTIVHANEILVMHEGEIVERGTHQELIRNPNSRYAILWRQQSEIQKNEPVVEDKPESNCISFVNA